MTTKHILLYYLIFIFQLCFAQNIKLIEYNYLTKEVDTLDIQVNSSKSSDFTSSHIGYFNDYIAELEDEFPTEHIVEGSRYTMKNRADDFYNIEDYPIRTAVRLNIIENDSIYSICSGSMVGSNFALTATHCLMSYIPLLGSNIKDVNYYVSPAFNNGNLSPSFYGSQVLKVYIPLVNGVKSDIALLKLREPIGLITGWIGFGYQESDQLIKEQLVYKFSYPALSNFLGNGLTFNGDTLYYTYGELNYFTESHLGVNKAKGIPGESGSTIFSANHDSYIAYGTLSYAPYVHTRITKPIFEAFKSRLNTKPPEYYNSVQAFPNPTADNFYIFSASKLDITHYKIFDVHGKCLLEKTNYDDINGVYIGHLKSGVYFFQYHNKNGANSIKIIKTNPS